MWLNRLTAIATLLALVFAKDSIAAESGPILFSNPLKREAGAIPQLQTLRFITVDGFAPFSAFDNQGILRGVHVELAKAICGELKKTTTCTLQAIAFEDIESQLISGQADVALAGLVPTAQTRKNLAFSIPYFRFASKLLVRKNVLLQNGTRIGVVKDTTHQKMAEALFPAYNITAFTNEDEAFASLKANTISAIFGDGLQLTRAQSQDASLNCCQLQPGNYFLPSIRPDSLNAAFSNSRADVTAAVDAALRQISVDGRLEEIYLRHMAVNPLK